MSENHINPDQDASTAAHNMLNRSPELRFECATELYGTIPEPASAQAFMPNWFRSLSRETIRIDEAGKTHRVKTAKACPPMVDAFTLGHIIPLARDTRLQVEEDGKAVCEGTDLTAFANPWRVFAPSGHHVHFMPVLNRPDLPFACTAQTFDCAVHGLQIDFPFVWSGPPGNHLVKAGTPLIQVIAVKNSARIVEHEARAAMPEELMDLAVAMRTIFSEEDAYQKHWRVRK